VRERKGEDQVAKKGKDTLEKQLKLIHVAVCCSVLQCVAVASHISTCILNIHICKNILIYNYIHVRIHINLVCVFVCERNRIRYSKRVSTI